MKFNRGIPLFLGLGVFLAGHVRAGDALPGKGYPASHYETLWTKSPFAVATPEAADQPSEFSLVGIANLDGVDYASLVNKQTNERYLLASGKPQNGLSLVSITHGQDRDKTSAVIQNKGQTLTLKLSDASSPALGANMPQTANAGMPGQPMNIPRAPNGTFYPQASGGLPSTMPPQTPAGGPRRVLMNGGTIIFNNNGQTVPGQPPAVVVRHPIIHVPAPPPQQQ